MQKLIIVIFCLSMFGCYSVEVKKEAPQSLNLASYQAVHLGWIDFPVGKWKEYRFENIGQWQKAIHNFNTVEMKKYFTKSLPGRIKILGPTRGMPRTGDLFMKFDYLGYDSNHVFGRTTPDRLHLRVEMYDIKRGRKIYSAVLGVDAYRQPGPGDWSVFRFEGRMALTARNLAAFIADKF